MSDAPNGGQIEQGRVVRGEVLPPEPKNPVREIPYSPPIRNVTPPLVDVDASRIAPSTKGTLIDRKA